MNLNQKSRSNILKISIWRVARTGVKWPLESAHVYVLTEVLAILCKNCQYNFESKVKFKMV